MKKTFVAVACAVAALGVTSVAQAQQAEGPFKVRLRGVYMKTDSGSFISPLGDVDLKKKIIPEVDLSYYFTPNIALELVLTYPQKHDVRLNGAKIGTVKELPPTLLAQYHFTNLVDFMTPYVGVGVNYTRISNVRLPTGVSVDKNSFGPALQLGVDFPITPQWSINVDVKRVWIDTDVKLGGAKLGTLDVDPWLFGVGVGYRF